MDNPNKKRVLFVHYLEDIGGGERYVVNVINALEAYCQVYILTPNDNSKLKEALNSSVIKFSKKFSRNLGPFPAFSMSLFWSVYRIVKDNNIDTLHINDHYLLLSILPLKYFLNVNIVFTSHGKWDIYFLINRVILNILNPKVIVATPIQFFRLNSLVKDVKLLPFFTKTVKQTLRNIQSRHIRIGVVGRFSPVKNHKLAFDIISSLDERYQLHIIGGKTLTIAEETIEYEQDILDKIGQNDKIHYHGFIENLDNIYANIDILLVSSHSESFSFSTIEALSFGIPVVSTMTEGSSYIIQSGYNGYICSGTEEFKSAIKEIVAQYRKFSDNAYESSNRYEEKIYIKDLLNIY